MKSVVIDFSPQRVARYRSDCAIVAIDVIRATTTLVTAVSAGRRCYVAESVEGARTRAGRLESALLAGELAGEVPAGFDLPNSPAAIALRADTERPMVLLSSSGTQVLCNASGCASVYVACFRNHQAVAEHLAQHHAQVAVIGAGTRGEFREEDQMCCAWIAARLIAHGYRARNAETRAIVGRWHDAPAEACLVSKSVDYLRRSGQLHDLDFVLSHVNDLNSVSVLEEGEVLNLENSRTYPAPNQDGQQADIPQAPPQAAAI